MVIFGTFMSQVRFRFPLDRLGLMKVVVDSPAYLVAGPRRRRCPPVTPVVSFVLRHLLFLIAGVIVVSCGSLMIGFKFVLFSLFRLISARRFHWPSRFVEMGLKVSIRHSSLCCLELLIVSLCGSIILARTLWSGSLCSLLDCDSSLVVLALKRHFQLRMLFCRVQVSSEGIVEKLVRSCLIFSVDRAKKCADILVFVPWIWFGSHAKYYCCCAIAVKRGRPSIIQHFNSFSDVTCYPSLLVKLLDMLKMLSTCNSHLMYSLLHY